MTVINSVWGGNQSANASQSWGSGYAGVPNGNLLQMEEVFEIFLLPKYSALSLIMCSLDLQG